MRLSGIGKSKELFDLVVGEYDRTLVLQCFQAGIDFGHTVLMSFIHDLLNRRGGRIKAVSEDMVFTEVVLAGEFDAEDEDRISRRKKVRHDLRALDRVVVSDRKVRDTGAFDNGKELFGSICPVGDRGVHVKIDQCHGCAVLSHFLFHDTKIRDSESTEDAPKSL